jgi:hypothetical protein
MALWSSPCWKVCREELLDTLWKLSSEANSSSAVLLPLEPDVWRELICVVRANGRPTGFLKTASWERVVDAMRACELLDSVEFADNGGRVLARVEESGRVRWTDTSGAATRWRRFWMLDLGTGSRERRGMPETEAFAAAGGRAEASSMASL